MQALALAKWRFHAFVEKSVNGKREKLFLVHNAKLEVHQSKNALQRLYRQKQNIQHGNYDTVESFNGSHQRRQPYPV